MSAVELLPPRWSLQPFERELAIREVEALARSRATWRADRISVAEPIAQKDLERLRRRVTFARRVLTDAGEFSTLQAELEAAVVGGGARKVTSHALHGLHPYKGKFYPQLARALLNICDIPEGGRVLDPFAGCGTTILEAGLLGCRGIGVDANPLAALVAQTKVRLLTYPVGALFEALLSLRRPPRRMASLPHMDYLERWFPPGNLRFLRRVIAAIAAFSDPVARDAGLVVLSSVLREASYQDPDQLRVYRRRDDVVPALADLFRDAIERVVLELEAVQGVVGSAWARADEVGGKIICGDSRRLKEQLRAAGIRRIDAVVTSPPYANALPYIDTDRLSLRAFGLLCSGGQRQAEELLIGNREITDASRRRLNEELGRELAERSWCPDTLADVLRRTQAAAAEPTSGFRKQRTPGLLFSYFRDMRRVFTDLSSIVKPGGPIAIVVGDNEVSGPGGTKVPVPTTEILTRIAGAQGLELELDLSKRLTSFGASETVHQRNAMEGERVLMFRVPSAE